MVDNTLPPFQIFGSEDSLDLDVVFFPEMMPKTIEQKLGLAKAYALKLKESLPNKIINPNLAICEEGIVAEVYKGTVDELNNSLYFTYPLHPQAHENQITQTLSRDLDLKTIRCLRVILSLMTKTMYREMIKGALNSDIYNKMEVLHQIGYEKISDWGKSQNHIEIKKTLAFQLGQTLALAKGVECYTKQQIIGVYPELSPYLYRKVNTEWSTIQEKTKVFLELLATRVPEMKQTEEYSYKKPN